MNNFEIIELVKNTDPNVKKSIKMVAELLNKSEYTIGQIYYRRNRKRQTFRQDRPTEKVQPLKPKTVKYINKYYDKSNPITNIILFT